MLSISSTFYEIEQALREKNIKAVKTEMQIGENKLRRLLNAAGYEYDTRQRQWHYTTLDESKDVREMSFSAFDEQLKSNTSNKGNTNILEDNMSNTQSNISNIQAENSFIFSQEEITVLKEIVQRHIYKQPEEANAPTILESIKALDSTDTDRKTFVIDKQLITQLDSFCELHRVRKSDVMSVAIYELLQKYK